MLLTLVPYITILTFYVAAYCNTFGSLPCYTLGDLYHHLSDGGDNTGQSL